MRCQVEVLLPVFWKVTPLIFLTLVLVHSGYWWHLLPLKKMKLQMIVAMHFVLHSSRSLLSTITSPPLHVHLALPTHSLISKGAIAVAVNVTCTHVVNTEG